MVGFGEGAGVGALVTRGVGAGVGHTNGVGAGVGGQTQSTRMVDAARIPVTSHVPSIWFGYKASDATKHW